MRVSRKKRSNFFIRISGDSPLVDVKIIDRAIALHKKKKKKNMQIL